MTERRSLSWKPIDPDNLPEGEVLGYSPQGLHIGDLNRLSNGEIIVAGDYSSLLNVSHYIPLSEIPLPTEKN